MHILHQAGLCLHRCPVLHLRLGLRGCSGPSGVASHQLRASNIILLLLLRNLGMAVRGVVCVMVAAVGVSQVQSSRLLELLLLLLGIVMELLRILSCMVRVLCILKRVGRLLLIVHRLGTLLLLRVCKLLRAIKLLRLVVKGRGPKHAARLLLPLLLLAAVLLLLAMVGLLR